MLRWNAETGRTRPMGRIVGPSSCAGKLPGGKSSWQDLPACGSRRGAGCTNIGAAEAGRARVEGAFLQTARTLRGLRAGGFVFRYNATIAPQSPIPTRPAAAGRLEHDGEGRALPSRHTPFYEQRRGNPGLATACQACTGSKHPADVGIRGASGTPGLLGAAHQCGSTATRRRRKPRACNHWRP